MLNAGNLVLIAYSRQLGDGDGQIFALTVMVVAAAEAVIGLGLIVAMSRLRAELDVDKLTSLRGMIPAAWIAPSRQAAAVVAIALAGMRISRFQAGLLAAGATLVSFICSVVVFVRLLFGGAGGARAPLDLVDVAVGG